MSINQRRALFAAFLLIFAVCSFAVILYASGYRYNTRLGRIEQVGLLSVSSQQGGVSAVINGKRYEVKRGLQLSSLLPGAYDILLTKDGYHPWTKQLTVSQGLTTFARDIRLFADTEAEPIELFLNNLDFVAGNTRWMVYRGNDALVVLDTNDRSIREWALPEQSFIDSPAIDSGDHLVLSVNGEWQSLRLLADTLAPQTIIAPEQTLRVTPHDGIALITTASDRVWEWVNGSLTSLFQFPEIQAVAARDESFVVVAADPTHKRSEIYVIASAHARPEFMATLPFAESISIADIVGSLLLVSDETNHNLYLVDMATTPAKTVTYSGVHTWSWSADRRALLTASKNELLISTVKNGLTQELIARQQEPILDAAWGPDEGWILFATATGISAAERDSRDTRNILPLVTNVQHTDLISVTKNDLLFSSQEEKNFVIWSLPFDQNK